ncbi:MAG: hypothetical protein ABI683_00660 [Ginsengibacter sp.]
MNNSVDILNELKEISNLLAGLEKKNVFRVPEGYFENLSDRLYTYALLNNADEIDFSKENVQQVPDGYFDSLSTNILAKIKQQYSEDVTVNEEQIPGVFASLKNVNVFTVPKGYFELLAPSILARIKKSTIETQAEETGAISELLFPLRNKNVFDVPDGYFDSLAGNILSKTKKEKIETTDGELAAFPLLQSLRNKNVFTIPGNYFESLAENVIEALKPAPAKVITMQPRRSWLKIAAAAVVTGAIAITSLQIFNNSYRHNDSNGVIAASIQMPGYIKESFQFKTEKEVDAGIAKLSDDDIVKYLEKNGNVLDNDLLLKNTDVSELPTQQDYLEDENTLNLYLDKIEKTAGSN